MFRARDGDVCVRGGQGVFAGDSIGPGVFCEINHSVLQPWAAGCQDELLMVRDPLDGHSYVDLSYALFVDDLLKRLLFDDDLDYKEKLSKHNDELNRVWNRVGIHQNKNKQQHLTKVSGVGSRFLYRALQASPGVRSSGRYLGPIISTDNKTGREIDIRINAVHRGWGMQGAFWLSSSPSRVKRVVFQAVCYGAAISGLIGLIISEGDEYRLNVVILRYGRKLMGGSACKKVEVGGQVQYVAVSNKKVWDFLGLVPVEITLRVDRLLWWQQISGDPGKYKLMITAVFGQVGEHMCPKLFDENKRLVADPKDVNPWLRQLCSDLGELEDVYDSGWELAEHPLRILSSEYSEDFRKMDPHILRSKFHAVAVPPVACSLQPEVSAFSLGGAYCYVCSRVEKWGECGKTFRTWKGLLTHQRFAHRDQHPAARFVINNVCPWCSAQVTLEADAGGHARTPLVIRWRTP